jgi:hypothetical protein
MTSSNISSSLEDAIVVTDDFFGDLPTLIADGEPIEETSEADSTEEIQEDDAMEDIIESTTTEEEEEQEDTQVIEESLPDPETSTEAESTEKEGDDLTELAKANYNFLVENNIIIPEEDYEFDGSTEELERLYGETKQKLATEAFHALWSRLNPDFQQALNYAANGGASLEDFYKMYKDTPQSISDLSLDSEEDQKRALKLYYEKTTKYPPEKINKFIDRIERDGDLEVEAEDALDYLKQNLAEEQARFQEQQKEQNEARIRQAQEARQRVVDAITASENIKGRAKKSLQAFLFNEITTKDNVTDTEFNFRLKSVFQNPEHLVQLADFMHNYDPDKGFNLRKYEERGETKATKSFQTKLAENLTSTQKKLTGKPPGVPDTTIDWETILKQID